MIRRNGRLRWRVADLLNRLPGQCWADLVSWALGHGDDRWWWPWRPVTESCLQPGDEHCYCGRPASEFRGKS